ncbi:FixH family protein [Cupriavidus necator]|uniref:FixH family protein n=1 Tax=Cupriavidus necator TaxID=106590 RepID=UPI00068BAD3A|nr:FixH family protein [Cupriavidus necator]
MHASIKTLSALAMFSMLFATSGCSTPPQNLDLSLDKSTEGGRYRIAVISPTPAPAVNQLHTWKVKLATLGGKPVKGAQFAVGGGMPQHGHGYPTQPRVTREIEDGTYLLEGMKFSMSGWWELKLGIRAEPGPDQVTFNIVIDPKSQRQ